MPAKAGIQMKSNHRDTEARRSQEPFLFRHCEPASGEAIQGRGAALDRVVVVPQLPATAAMASVNVPTLPPLFCASASASFFRRNGVISATAPGLIA